MFYVLREKDFCFGLFSFGGDWRVEQQVDRFPFRFSHPFELNALKFGIEFKRELSLTRNNLSLWTSRTDECKFKRNNTKGSAIIYFMAFIVGHFYVGGSSSCLGDQKGFENCSIFIWLLWRGQVIRGRSLGRCTALRPFRVQFRTIIPFNASAFFADTRYIAL